MKRRKIWLAGQIIDVNDARINVLAPTAQFGANVFEGIRCYWNDKDEQLYAFRLREHYKRLLDSIKLFRMNAPYTVEDLTQYMKEVVRANNYREDIAVRQTVFIDGDGSWFAKDPVEMFIAPIEKSRKKNPIEKAEKTCVSSYERISDRTLSPRVKVGANYMNSRLAKLEAEENGYDSALFLNHLGNVAEGTGSCFFMVKDEKLITPLLTDSVLESITRDTILRISGEDLGLEVIERSINRSELYSCDEAFFCGSAAEITPVGQIDSFMIGDGKSGRITNRIHKAYLDVATGINQKYTDFLTPIYD